ncbi:Pv-fam-c protein [Plasmodium vivax India VII]|uniref:Pv-fam-c protein n=1 Tax=Plasmodium vivax India VII TaxID=1077284 RepID=A0A0J9SHS6_PLAVI|nr:Pv-fam-c protein [Plasmodium vivax India VII]
MTKKNQQSVYDQVIQNLPSFKHCSELKRNVLYLTIQYLIKNENIKFINQWISKLQGRLDKYLKEKKHTWNTINPDKRCRDINYVIDDITHGIRQLKKHRNVWLDHQINKTVIDVLNANRFFNCDRIFKYENSKYRLQRKIMDDLCENFNYISNNMNNYKNKHMCEGVASYIASNKSYLKKLFSDVKIRNDPIFNFDSNCTIDFIEKSITPIVCNNETKAPQALQEDSEVKLEDDVSEAALAAVEANQLDDPDPGEMAQFFIEDDTPFYLRPTNIGTAAIGIPLLSLIIYKTKARGQNRMKNNFSQDGKETEELLINSIEPLELKSQNSQYNISYQSVND